MLGPLMPQVAAACSAVRSGAAGGDTPRGAPAAPRSRPLLARRAVLAAGQSACRFPAVDHDGLPGDVGRLIRSQKSEQCGDLLGSRVPVSWIDEWMDTTGVYGLMHTRTKRSSFWR